MPGGNGIVAAALRLSDADHSETKGEAAILIRQNPSFLSLFSPALKLQWIITLCHLPYSLTPPHYFRKLPHSRLRYTASSYTFPRRTRNRLHSRAEYSSELGNIEKKEKVNLKKSIVAYIIRKHEKDKRGNVQYTRIDRNARFSIQIYFLMQTRL